MHGRERKTEMTISGPAFPKYKLDRYGTIVHVAAQGTAHANAMVSFLPPVIQYLSAATKGTTGIPAATPCVVYQSFCLVLSQYPSD